MGIQEKSESQNNPRRSISLFLGEEHPTFDANRFVARSRIL